MMTTNMVRVELGGESVEIEEANWQEAADKLHAKHGGGVPKVTRLAPPMAQIDTTAAEVVAAVNAPMNPPPPRLALVSPRKPSKGLTVGSPLDVAPGKIDLIGQARSTFDAEAAAAAGFAVAPPLFDRGTRVIDLGVENAAKARQEWEAMPLVRANCEAHAARIVAEDRQDDVALAGCTEMGPSGIFRASHVDQLGVVSDYKLTEAAFASLVARLGIPAAGRYLRQCWPELRAQNINGWIERIRESEHKAAVAAKESGRANTYAPIDLRLRHRRLSRPEAGAEREVYGIVSPSYADLDADKISEAIALAVHPEARGRVTYDGRRTRWEILFHSTVQPKHYVAGEFFRAGATVTTDDAGGGAINGNAIVWQNLCLNLIVVQTTTTAHFAIRHMGDVAMMAKRFREGFAKTMGAIDHFVRAWDYAVEDNVITSVRQIASAAGRALPASTDEVMAGIFRDAIDRELVPVPVGRARTEDVVTGLMSAWRSDKSGAAGTTRAAVANAFTRWAHTGANLDPWAEDEIQSGAGLLIQRTKKDNGWSKSLGFLAPEDLKER